MQTRQSQPSRQLEIQGKGSPYSITERRVPELIPVLGSQSASDVSHKPGGRLPLLSARPAVTPATLKRAATKTVTRQSHCCDLNPGLSAPESSTLTTRLLSDLASCRLEYIFAHILTTLAVQIKQSIRCVCLCVPKAVFTAHELNGCSCSDKLVFLDRYQK